MLTKEERKAIAERISEEFDFTENDEVYEALIGEEIPGNTTWGADCKVVRDRLIELCDTSNMIELPLDKDGQVIRVGDTVFNQYGIKHEVDSLKFCAEYGCAVISTDCNGFICTHRGDELIHKSNATVESLSDNIRGVLARENSNIDDVSYTALMRIADQLKELAGKDEE